MITNPARCHRFMLRRNRNDPPTLHACRNYCVAIGSPFRHHGFREKHSRHGLTPPARRLTLTAAAFSLAAFVSPAHAQLAPNWEESGQASWYGPGFVGKRTSSGQVFDPRALTAAHDTLPLGTRVLVTTQETGRSVVVTITDRLPPKRLRVIDVSRAAATKLGLIGTGVGMVTLSTPRDDEPIEVAEAPDDDAPAVNPRPRGPRHTHRASRRASAHR